MRMPTRAALSTYAGPTPRPVVPMRRLPSLASEARSSAGWYGMIRWAFFEMNRVPSRGTPRRTRASISSMSEPGSTTTPQPITQRQPGCRMPEGIVCKTYFSRPTTTVWPALFPPAYRATTFTWGASRSTTFPLPSSPHCVPTTTMLGMAHTSKDALRMLENLTDSQHALRPVRKAHCQYLAGTGARVTHDQDMTHALGARIGDRLVEPTADDVARDRRAQIAQPAGQRQRHRLVGREVDNEEIGPGLGHRDALRLHDRQRPADVEREADGRAVVAEAAEHVVVPAATRDRRAEAGHVCLEVRARVVVEAANLAQVEQHTLAEPIDLQQAIDLGQVRQRPARALVAREAGRQLQHRFTAEERRQRQQRVAHVRRRRQIGDQPLEGRAVLAGQRRAQLAPGNRIGLRLIEEAADEVGVTEVDLEPLEPERPEPFDGHRDDFHFGLGLIQSDQLDSRLVELAVVRDAGLVVAEHVRHVAEPDGLGLVAQPGRHHACDLGRDIGSERQHPPGLAVDEREHVALHGLVGPGREHVGELERRRDDLAVAPAAKHVEQRSLDVTLPLRLVRQIDTRALGELRVARLHGATPSRCETVFMRCTVAQSGSYSSSVIPPGAASTVQRRSSPSPRALRTMTRITIEWLTSTIVWSACACRSSVTPAATRSPTLAMVSPPSGAQRCGVERHCSHASGKRARMSSRVSPSHAPKAISAKAGAIRTGRRYGSAISSAEARARSSGLA